MRRLTLKRDRLRWWNRLRGGKVGGGGTVHAAVGGNVEQDFRRLPLQLTLHKRFELKAPRLPAPSCRS